MVAAAAIHRPACRITGEAVVERGVVADPPEAHFEADGEFAQPRGIDRVRPLEAVDRRIQIPEALQDEVDAALQIQLVRFGVIGASAVVDLPSLAGP